MKLPKKLLAAAGDDPTRACLTVAHIDPENRRIVICDGRVLAAIPIPGDATIKPGCITVGTWKAITKGAKELEYDPAAGTVNGQPLDEPECLGQYPNYTQVIPRFEPAYRIGFDVRLLANIADSMGVDNVTLELQSANSPEAIIVRTDWQNPESSAFGVLMPMRPERNLYSKCGLLTAAPQSERSNSAADNSAEIIAALRQELAEANDTVAGYKAHIARMNAATVKPLDATPATVPSRPPKREKEKPQVPSASAPPVLSRNEDRNGIELRFNGKPDDATRLALKSRGFRWLPGQPGQPWAARYSEEALIFATTLAEGRVPGIMPLPEPENAAPANASQPADLPPPLSLW